MKTKEPILKHTGKSNIRGDKTVKRGNKFSIDPRLIVVDFNKSVTDGGNPRKLDSYGTPEEWSELKESILNEGILQNIKLYIDADGNKCLSHGYRRLKAVLELIEEGHNIESVPFDLVSNNEEKRIVDHLVLNTGTPLTDLEKAEAIRQLSVLTGKTSPADLHKLTYIPAQKISVLMNFISLATTQVKDKLASKKISFDTANKLATKSKNTREQNALLKQGETAMKEAGDSKIMKRHISGLRTSLSFDTQFGLLLSKANKSENVDREFLERLQTLITLIKDGSPESEQLSIFLIQETA